MTGAPPRDPAEARRRVEGLRWWHAIEVAPGVVTPGGWDLRPTAALMPWPGALAGLRCLDVGTMDGFWAFEMERRGAAEVVALDVLDPARLDAPGGRAAPPARTGGQPRGATFACAADLLGSRATLVDMGVHDLAPERTGMFDLVFLGYVLQMVRDPLGALEAVRSVCRGHVVVLDTVSVPLGLLPAPLARLNARRGALEWFVFNRRGLAQAVAMAGFRVEARTRVLRDAEGPGVGPLPRRVRALHAAGALGRSAAVLGRAPV